MVMLCDRSARGHTPPLQAAVHPPDGRPGPDTLAPAGRRRDPERLHACGGDLIANQPGQVAWSDEGLRWLHSTAPPDSSKARVTDFGWHGLEDDCVRCISTAGTRIKDYQFIVNALGTRFDALGGDRAFSAEWQAAAVNGPGSGRVSCSSPGLYGAPSRAT